MGRHKGLEGTQTAILVPRYEKFKVKERCGAARASGILYRDKIRNKHVYCTDYKGFDWFFATNIDYEKIFSYVLRRDGA